MKKIIVMLLSSIMLLSTIVTVKADTISIKKKIEREIIVIDPGHGGFDGGATSKNGTIEKEINLEIALKLKKILKKAGFQVYLTRETDCGLYSSDHVKNKKSEDLYKRIQLKREKNCDIFISIHQNMFEDNRCFGSQVWYASNEKSELLARAVQQALKDNIKNENRREAKSAGEAFYILRDGHKSAALIVECGFLSNPDEEAKLKTNKYQKKIAESIAKGIEAYVEINSEKK